LTAFGLGVSWMSAILGMADESNNNVHESLHFCQHYNKG
jgi:hypothetical protein